MNVYRPSKTPLTASEVSTAGCSIFEALIPAPAAVTLFDGFTPADGPVREILTRDRTDLGDDGYQLTCDRRGFCIAANSRVGVHYAHQTLLQLRSLGPIPCCEILDAPAMRMRAVMFDLARCKEKHEYYYAMIDQLSQWKINTVFLHLTDHSGCAIQFQCYPGLATPYAFSTGEVLDLVRYASERHIELIPEIEAWGHASYITRHPEFADLAEDRDDPRALCTMNPGTWEVLGNILRETAELFPSDYIHVGCDEAPFGRCGVCLDWAERHGTDALAGEHVRRVCELASSMGKTPMVWGDVLLAHPGATAVVPKNTVICDWHYETEVSPESVKLFAEQGFRVLGCPSILWGSRMILPRTDTLRNLESFADVVLDHGCLGMKTTVWIPQRCLSDTLTFGLAYASELAWSGRVRSREQFAAAFARAYFGLEPSSAVIEALIGVHDLADKCFDRVVNLWRHSAELARRDSDELLLADVDGLNHAARVLNSLLCFRPEVSCHRNEYDALTLAAAAGKHIRQRDAGIHKLVYDLRITREMEENGDAAGAREHVRSAIEFLEGLVSTETDIRRRMEQAWDRWRYSDDPLKKSRGENLLGAFYSSERYALTMLERVTEIRDHLGNGARPDWDGLFVEPTPAQH